MINYATSELSTKQSLCSDSITLQCELADCRQQLAQYMADMQSIDAVIDNCVLALSTIDNYNGSEKQALAIINCHNAMENLLGVAASKITIAAAQEGLGETLHKAWEAFVNLCKKIWETLKSWASKFINFITGKKESSAEVAKDAKETADKIDKAVPDAKKNGEALAKEVQSDNAAMRTPGAASKLKVFNAIVRGLEQAKKTKDIKLFLGTIPDIKLLPAPAENAPASMQKVDTVLEKAKKLAESASAEKPIIKQQVLFKMYTTSTIVLVELPKICTKAIRDCQITLGFITHQSNNDERVSEDYAVRAATKTKKAFAEEISKMCKPYGIDISINEDGSMHIADGSFGTKDSPKNKEFMLSKWDPAAAGYTDARDIVFHCNTTIENVYKGSQATLDLFRKGSNSLDGIAEPVNKSDFEAYKKALSSMRTIERDITRVINSLWSVMPVLKDQISYAHGELKATYAFVNGLR